MLTKIEKTLRTYQVWNQKLGMIFQYLVSIRLNGFSLTGNMVRMTLTRILCTDMFTALTYFAAQVVSMTALALMGLTFLIAQPKNINARLFAVICLSTISYIISTMQYQSNPEFQIDLSAYWLPLQIMMNIGAGCLMILCYSLFQDMNRFPRWILGIYGIQVSLSTLRPLFVSNNLAEIDIESIGAINYFIFGTLPILLQFFFALAATFWVIKGWQVDVVESRRLLRQLFLAVLLVLFFGGTASELYVMNADSAQRLTVSLYKNYVSALLNFIAALFCLRFEPILQTAVKTINRGQEAELDDEFEPDLDNFHRIFRDQKAYLEPGLSIADLAKKLAMPQYKLRHLINTKLGYRNFNALLNKFRIKDACEQFSDPEKNQSPVLTIALTVGYQSIAPFNQAFRELKGVTPTEFRKKSQREIHLAERGVPTAS